jgi:hypothetical protein
MVYPLETNITWISGKDDMTSYAFGKERIAHSFCPTCGTVSSIYLSPPLPLPQPASFGAEFLCIVLYFNRFSLLTIYRALAGSQLVISSLTIALSMYVMITTATPNPVMLALSTKSRTEYQC